MRNYKLHPLYWKLRLENWTLEDFVRRSRRNNVQCKILAGAKYANLVRRRFVKQRRSTSSGILAWSACLSVWKKASR